ncbi:MAG: ATP-binding protein, partial [Candidatus Nanoarchaeia archaeon]
EKFFQAESSLTRNFGGSGLGLSIVKGILDEHGGTISVRSALKNGSVFTVKIPLNRPVDEVKRKLNIQEKLKVLEKKRKRQKTSLKKFSSEEEVAAFFK